MLTYNPLKLIFFSLIFLIFLCFSYYLFVQKTNKTYIKFFLVIGMSVIQVFGLFLWISFDPFLVNDHFNHGFQFFFIQTINPMSNLILSFGVDGISITFILLTIVIFSLCVFIINVDKVEIVFSTILLILELILILVFATLDLFSFYIFFEGSLIPMFFIVGNWGSRSRKLKATFYLFLYTMATASLTLTGIFYIINQVGSSFYPDILDINFSESEQIFLWFFFFITFITKIPAIPFHIWLPEAHVEAPTIGSVILASILLKLGGFGCIRYLIPIYPFANIYFLPLVYTICISSVLYASLITIRQIDLKRIIAYSSIAHMNMALIGIFTYNNYGLDGSIYLMVGHGVVSTALFLLVGIVYDRYHTRLLRYYGGLIVVMPLYGIFFFIFTLGNIGFPTTSNFIGETLIIIGVFYQNIFAAALLGCGIILSAVYSMWLYNRIFFGSLRTSFIFSFSDITNTEFLIFLYLAFVMFFLGVNGNSLLELNLMTVEQVLIRALL